MATYFANLNLESAEIVVLPRYHNGKNETCVTYVLTRNGREELRCFENRLAVKSLAVDATEAAKKVGDATARTVGLKSSDDAEQRLSALRGKAEAARERWLQTAQNPASVDIKINGAGYTYLALHDPFPMKIVIGNARAIGAIFSTNEGTAGCTVSVVHPWYAAKKAAPAEIDAPGTLGTLVATASPKEGDNDDGHHLEPIEVGGQIDPLSASESANNGDKEVAKFEAKLAACGLPAAV